MPQQSPISSELAQQVLEAWTFRAPPAPSFCDLAWSSRDRRAAADSAAMGASAAAVAVPVAAADGAVGEAVAAEVVVLASPGGNLNAWRDHDQHI